MNSSEHQINLPGLPSPISAIAEKACQVLASVGEEAFELTVALLVMIMVERANGQQGLGVYAYLMACLYAVRYFANYGVTNYVERETALLEKAGPRQSIIASGLQASVITGMAAAILLLSTAGFDASHTQVQERTAAYFVMALMVPLANLNQLKLAVLNGRGQHSTVARLRIIRQGVILCGMFLFTRTGLPSSYLLIVILLADAVMAAAIRRYFKLPPFRTAFKHAHKVTETLKQGQAYLFTDNALDLLLNIDLFVLGLFVTALDLGIYAEAAVLIRFFLIVPMAIKPILRRWYVRAATGGDGTALRSLFQRNQALLFSLHAVLALQILLYFPAVLEFFFGTRAGAAQSFRIFTIILPGLVFYGPLCAQEPVYEALDQVERLKRLSLSVACINFFLTIYLVPVAGTYGAATATMLTMLIYVGLFGSKLTMAPDMDKASYFIAGLGLYLLFMLLRWTGWSAAISVWAVPMILMPLFYACGLYGVQTRRRY